ncbi:MAG: hypothetical protein IKZ11_00055, partial [Alistipes sp.]|nr:hypothetical protein [Alistipes sp.]
MEGGKGWDGFLRVIQNSKFKIQALRLFCVAVLFLLKKVVCSEACESNNLGRSIGGKRAEVKICVKKWRLFDCFKNANGIHFNIFSL